MALRGYDLTRHDDGTAAHLLARWIRRQVARGAANERGRLGVRILAGTLVLASGGAMLGAALPSLTAMDPMLARVPSWVFAAMLAFLASGLTGAGLYSFLHRRDRILLGLIEHIALGNLDLLQVLARVSALHDRDTEPHSLRVAYVALKFGERLGWGGDELLALAKGALVHDVGKLAVPDAVLTKPGPLTPEERQEMNSHVVRGLAIVGQSAFLGDTAAIVGGHHEHYDGSGYPAGLKGTDIPSAARLFALVDVYDALTSPRVYKAALPPAQALAEMQNGRGRQFDPVLFDQFTAIMPDLEPSIPADPHHLLVVLVEAMLPYLRRRLTHSLDIGVGMSKKMN